VVVPPRGYLKRMREVAGENGILFIADEVVTAFGRVGHWFASQDVFGIEPDMIVSAKGLTSGYLPLGVTIYSDAIHEAISQPGPEVWFAHGFTYSGHPVCCAAALKNIEIIEREDLLAHARKVGDHFERRLKELEALRIVGEARGMRMMMCVEFVADKATKAHLPDEINISKRISNLCEERGLLVRPMGHLDVMSPPLTLSIKEADFLVDTLGGAVEEVTHDLVKGGMLPPLSRPIQHGGN
jgi:adenosylmethionine-8-amino-7-oxononanoate aminotransferase